MDENIDTETFRNVERLKQLRVEHQDLDQVIARLVHDPHVDQVAYAILTDLLEIAAAGTMPRR